jgi:hypothetical protein
VVRIFATVDGLDVEIKAIDAHLVRLATLAQVNKAAAQPVTGDTVAHAAASRGGVISVRDTLPPGKGRIRCPE